MNGLTEGRNVHFVMPNLEHRPAIVVRVWDKENGVVNLQVFTDGENDARYFEPQGEESDLTYQSVRSGILWRTSILHDPTGVERNTWHWIEQA